MKLDLKTKNSEIMAKKENLYPAIAAIASVPLSVTWVLGIAGGVESLFNEFSLIVLIEFSLIVIITSFCVFFGTKTQIIEQQIKKLSEEYKRSLQTQSDLLQTLSDSLQTLLDSFKNLADLSAEIIGQGRPQAPSFKIGLS